MNNHATAVVESTAPAPQNSNNQMMGGLKSHYRLVGSASEQDAFNAGVDWQPATGLHKFVNRSKAVRNGHKKRNNGSKACQTSKTAKTLLDSKSTNSIHTGSDETATVGESNLI